MLNSHPRIALALAALGLGHAAAAGPCNPSWEAIGVPDLSSSVSAQAVYDEGNGPALYAGGLFALAGGQSAGNIARWNGAAWEPIGAGAGAEVNGRILAMAVFDDGSGPALYIGGEFTAAGDIPNVSVARWDGVQFSAVGGAFEHPSGAVIRALHVHDDGSGPALFAGGRFSTAGAVAASAIARWNGAAWAPVGNGMSNSTGTASYVAALTTYQGALYAGGLFDVAGTAATVNAARWDGSAWHGLTGGSLPTGGAVLALAGWESGPRPGLYAGGLMSQGARVWNGSSWSIVSTTNQFSINSLVVFDDGSQPFPVLYATGLSGIMRFNGISWSTVGGGLGGQTGGGSARRALTLAVHDLGDGPRLHVGGELITAGPTGQHVTSPGFVARSANNWHPMPGLGGGGEIHAIQNIGDDLIVGGPYQALLTSSGDAVAPAARRTAAGTWVSASQGLGFMPLSPIIGLYDLRPSPFSADLLGVGVFAPTDADGSRNAGIFTGTNWVSCPPFAGVSPQGYPFATVRSLRVNGEDWVFFSGTVWFTRSGHQYRGLLFWNGATITDFGFPSSTNTYPRDAVVVREGNDDVLYTFDGYAPQHPEGDVFRFSNGVWSRIPGAFDGPGAHKTTLYSIASFDDGSGPAIYVGGAFTSVDGVPANNIARWTGTQWVPVGAGLGDDFGPSPIGPVVAALEVFDDGGGNALFAAGNFTSAGGLPAANIARYRGGAWSAVGEGLTGGIQSQQSLSQLVVSRLRVLEVEGAQWLYAGGTFVHADGHLSPKLARFGGCPPNCPADFNNDGQVDFFDYLDFIQAFADEDPSADFNNDGQVDFFDYLDFIQAFAEGC